MAFQEDVILEYISLLRLDVFFLEDDLHGDILASILFIQWIFVGPCELANISRMLTIARVIIRHFVFCVSRFQSQIPHMFFVRIF